MDLELDVVKGLQKIKLTEDEGIKDCYLREAKGTSYRRMLS
jgi:hypothetical protein